MTPLLLPNALRREGDGKGDFQKNPILSQYIESAIYNETV